MRLSPAGHAKSNCRHGLIQEWCSRCSDPHRVRSDGSPLPLQHHKDWHLPSEYGDTYSDQDVQDDDYSEESYP